MVNLAATDVLKIRMRRRGSKVTVLSTTAIVPDRSDSLSAFEGCLPSDIRVLEELPSTRPQMCDQ